MNKWLFPAITALALLSGCSSVQRGSIPVVDSSTAVSNNDRISANGGFRQTVTNRPAQAKPQAMPQDSGVVVMVPGSGAATSAPISAEPWTPGPSNSGPIDTAPIQTAPINQGTYNMPSTPSGIPSSSSSGGLSADEQLDGPVLALLTTAQQQQAGGDLNGASSSLERAQRVAPREPQVLYRLAQVRMEQASLWALIGDARAAQGDAAGAAQARQKAKVSL
ncbi:hypothetical protein AO284_05305 [Pseudomonas sp. NZIPFR-PS2]|nr:hypothetical protein AO284_05305 [Pseudomonas sp. NZIPFR-PS2]